MLVTSLGVSILMTACGGDDRANDAPTSGAAAESAYCDLARDWSWHERAPVDEGDPAAARPYWKEYLAFNAEARRLAPASIEEAWAANDLAVRTQLTPILEKYDFDKQRMIEQATDEEKAIAGEPSEDVQEAQASIHRYESEVCAAAQPAAADVDFSRQEKPTGYCDAVSADREMFGGALAAGAKEDFQSLLTSKEYEAVVAQVRDTAPEAIKADADALYEHWRTKQVPMVTRRGYDIRAILIDGPQPDREILQSTSAEVRDHYARVAAYEEQVCGQ